MYMKYIDYIYSIYIYNYPLIYNHIYICIYPDMTPKRRFGTKKISNVPVLWELGGENFTSSSWMFFFKLLGLKCHSAWDSLQITLRTIKSRKPTSDFSPTWFTSHLSLQVKAPSHTMIKGQSAKPSTRWKLARTASIILSITWSRQAGSWYRVSTWMIQLEFFPTNHNKRSGYLQGISAGDVMLCLFKGVDDDWWKNDDLFDLFISWELP